MGEVESESKSRDFLFEQQCWLIIMYVSCKTFLSNKMIGIDPLIKGTLMNSCLVHCVWDILLLCFILSIACECNCIENNQEYSRSSFQSIHKTNSN